MDFTSDWFSPNIDNWTRWLAEFKGKPGIRCLEIGSYEGRSTVWLLENVLTGEGSTIDCCDFFPPATVDRFRANTARWANRVRVHQGWSCWTLRGLEGEFDVVYVDGDHRAFATLSDAVLAWPLLKVGGIMIFDDYLWLPEELNPESEKAAWSEQQQLQLIEKNADKTPKAAVDAFLAAMVGQYEVVGRGYQVAVKKTKASPLRPPAPAGRSKWLSWLR